MKLCRGCGTTKARYFFTPSRYWHKGERKSGLKNRCKECRVKETAEWRKRKGRRWADPLTGKIQGMVASMCHAGSKLRSSHLRRLYAQQDGRCYYTGVKMLVVGRAKMDPLIMSIERKQPSLGYVEGNVVLCCLGINYLKNSADEATMYEALSLFAAGAKRTIARRKQ